MKFKKILFYNAIYLLVYFFITFGMSIYLGKPFNVISALLIGLFFSGIFSLCLYFIPDHEVMKPEEKSEKIEENAFFPSEEKITDFPVDETSQTPEEGDTKSVY